MALAMITGASSGIGLELAELFAQRGYDLVVAAENDGIYPASDSLSRWGVDVRPVQVDLRTPRASRSSIARPPRVIAGWTRPR
ncbi:short chain dehydrogenase family protein [Mycobacterium avium MAV_120709_2344]|nr:short chain dehydrogenase family protein [Mycobacterium avium MAV_120709_2344]